MACCIGYATTPLAAPTGPLGVLRWKAGPVNTDLIKRGNVRRHRSSDPKKTPAMDTKELEATITNKID
jgi:hypothetical protein